jgi:uncharacterized protein
MSESAVVLRRARVASLDVARAVALVGVFSQNYVVAFNLGPLASRSWPEAFHGPLARAVDLYQGPLTTRFAAALVTIFGIGLTLLSRKEHFSPWVPVRRGLFLLVIGMWFNTVWPGTILPFYGAYLILLAACTKVRRSWLLLIGALTITALTFVVRLLVFFATENHPERFSEDLSWLVMRDPSGSRIGLSNPRGFVGSMLFWGAHPLLPWLAFGLVGMWIGRQRWQDKQFQVRLAGVGAAMLASGYALSSVMTRVSWSGGTDRFRWAWGTAPSSPFFDPPIKFDSPLYVVTAVGSSLLGIGVVLLVAEKFAASRMVRTLAGAGTVTLSIYVLHAVIPAALFRWGYRNQDVGVGWAVLIAVGGWTTAMLVGSWWSERVGLGPVERFLRAIGGR